MYRKYGRNYCGRLFDRETAEGALKHWGEGGGLCTYIKKLDAEYAIWQLLVSKVYQMRSGIHFVRRKIGVVGVESVKNLLKEVINCKDFSENGKMP